MRFSHHAFHNSFDSFACFMCTYSSLCVMLPAVSEDHDPTSSYVDPCSELYSTVLPLICHKNATVVTMLPFLLLISPLGTQNEVFSMAAAPQKDGSGATAARLIFLK